MSSFPFLDMKAVTASQREELDGAVQKIFDSSMFLFGEDVSQFEENFAKWVGTSHCVGAANGTSALEMALRGAKIGKGDKVVVQTNTFAASVMAIVHCGAEPVFVDCDARGRMDLDQAFSKCLATGAKAIMVVHLYGECVDMARVSAFTKDHGVILIEDCAQAHGTAWEGRKVGSFGLAGCFSFYPGKNLGACGDAGAVVTNDAALADDARTVGTIGAKTKYLHTMLGINSRMDTIQAAVLNVKLPALDGWNEKRRQVAGWYEEDLASVTGLHLLQPPSGAEPQMTHTYHLLIVVIEDQTLRDGLLRALKEAGVGALIHYPYPCHTMDAFHEFKGESHPVAEKLAKSMISLPMHPFLKREDVREICRRLVHCLASLQAE